MVFNPISLTLMMELVALFNDESNIALSMTHNDAFNSNLEEPENDLNALHPPI